MKPGWIIGIFSMFVGLQVIMGICEMSYPTNTANVFTVIMNPEFSASYFQDLFSNFWKVLWFDYPFLTGAWQIVRYGVFMPISLGMIITMFLVAPMATLIGTGVLGIAAGVSFRLGG